MSRLDWTRFLVVVSLLQGCGFVVGNLGNPKPKDENPKMIACDGRGVSELPEVPEAGSQLTFSVGSGVSPCSVSGYVVGRKDVLKVQMAAGGQFYINDVPGGMSDVVIVARPAGAALLGEEGILGTRLGKVEFLNGVRTDRGLLDLPRAGSIGGYARLIGQTDHAGIDVYIPGTDFIAKTDANGIFSLADVPVGEHNLYFEKDGYHRGQIESLIVESNQTTSVEDVDLALSTGAEGFLLIEMGSESVASRTVKLTIGATPDAVLMKVAETSDFLGASWRPLVTSTTYTFATPGEKVLYITFADANGLESSAFDARIDVVLFTDADVAFDLSKQSITAPVPPTFQLSMKLPENAASMLVSTDTELGGAVWVPAADSYAFALPMDGSSCGTHQLLLKVKDIDGFESPVASQDIAVKCWQDLGIHEDLPDHFDFSAAIADNKLVFWGGYMGDALDSLMINTGYYLDLDDLTWYDLPQAGAIPSKRNEHRMVGHGNKLYVWGGEGVGGGLSVLDDGAVYDFSTGNWTTLPSSGAPAARARHGAAWIGDGFLVFGGSSGASSLDNGGIYSMTTGWSAITAGWNYPQALQNGRDATWTGTDFLMVGGTTGGMEIFKYSISGASWSSVTVPYSIKQYVVWADAGASQTAIRNRALIFVNYPIYRPTSQWLLYDPTDDSSEILPWGNQDMQPIAFDGTYVYGKNADGNLVRSKILPFEP